MKNKIQKESNMLKEVWSMKEKIYQETKNKSSKEFFSYIKEKSNKIGSIGKKIVLLKSN